MPFRTFEQHIHDDIFVFIKLLKLLEDTLWQTITRIQAAVNGNRFDLTTVGL